MRSKFEEKIAKQMDDAGVNYEYEQSTYTYNKKVRSAECGDCRSKDVYQLHRYTVDFDVYVGHAATFGFHIETKGIFSPSDRAKMLLMKEQHPKVEIRLVFQRDNKIPVRGKQPRKKKPTSYTEWAKFHGFKYAVGEVPKEWLI